LFGGKEVIVVIFAVQKQNRDIISEAVRMLEKHFTTVRAYGGILCAQKPNPSLIICDMDSFDTIKADKAIIICKDILSLSNRLKNVKHGVAVVDSSIYPLSESLPDIGLPAITCGLHSRDTITLSSIGEDSAVIGVQRAISNFNGSITEPQEFPIHFAKAIAPFTLMAVAAIFILSGNCNLIKGKM
jgi:hypothetical protein